jgi:hypothetical protein
MQAGKSQVISFNLRGIITESDNTLFPTGGLAGHALQSEVPFIRRIFPMLKSLKSGDQPLFFPRVRLDMENYSGLCDFIFTRIKGATRDCFIWIIYDNSLHYGMPHNGISGGQAVA